MVIKLTPRNERWLLRHESRVSGSGSGFATTLLGRLKRLFSNPDVKKMITSGLRTVADKGVELAKEHLPQLANLAWRAFQEHGLKKKDKDIEDLNPLVKTAINAGLNAGLSSAKNALDKNVVQKIEDYEYKEPEEKEEIKEGAGKIRKKGRGMTKSQKSALDKMIGSGMLALHR